MADLSEQYISLRAECRGKKELDANEVNPLLREFRRKLEQFKIDETRSDGKQCKIWTQDVDEFNSELLNDGKTLLFSHKIKLNIFDPHPHSHNNYAHSIQVKIAKGLGKIKLENEKIIIVTTGIRFAGDGGGDGRWPAERFAGIGI